MATQLHSPSEYHTHSNGTAGQNEANASGVSWSAVLAGGFVTASLALILLSLGTGLGLSSVSLWSNVGASASAISAAAIIWLIATQVISSAMGGYLAGRLRTKWTAIHSDEVYFRDTAHGFLAWAVAIVVTAAFLGTAATSLMGSAASSKGPANVASEGRDFGSNDYFVDALFRSQSIKTDAQNPASRNEAGTILVNALGLRELSTEDKNYLDQLVMARTGMPQGDADKQVSAVFEDARQAAEKERKILAHTLLWAFVALLSGAFCASLSATFGGRQRDHVVTL
jgi:hypothetical protein